MRIHPVLLSMFPAIVLLAAAHAEEWHVPYSPPCTERQNVFAFTQKPAVKMVGKDRYEITFAVKGFCDVAVGLLDKDNKVVRHLACGVLGKNAPEPFRKDSLSQKIYWNGKDDLQAYVKEPEKLKVQVSLGLKASFDKRLGGKSPYNIAGFVLGIATDEEGAYVFTRGQGSHNNVHLRKYDHDGKYIASLAPPPANLPKEKLGGRAFIEYEPGKFAHHGPEIEADMGYDGNVIPGLGKKSVADIQPVVCRKRIFFCNAGPGHRSGNVDSLLHYQYTDGSTDVRGLKGRVFYTGQAKGGRGVAEHLWPRFAASPDGKWIYMVGLKGREGSEPAVLRLSTDGDDNAVPFIGAWKEARNRFSYEMGKEDGQFNNPTGIDTDSAGRIYVADRYNNRVQIFSPDGKHLKTIKIDRPELVCVHKKTGAMYVQHVGRVRGKSVQRISKLKSFDDPTVLFYKDGIHTSSMAVDSWAARPRIWIGGGIHNQGSTITALYQDKGPSATMFEDTGKDFKKLLDFDEEAGKEAGRKYIGRWSGQVFDHVVCDPTREQAYYKCYRNNPFVFSLETGEKIRRVRFPGSINDIAFCKRGYLHAHNDPGFYMPGVGRLDPDQASPFKDHLGKTHKEYDVYAEVPYDYGVELSVPHKRGWIGGIPVKDQPGAKYFQDGFGVNMMGDVAEQSNIYYVPKMEEEGWSMAAAGRMERDQSGELSGPSRYPQFLKQMQELEKQGERVFFIPRRPGSPLAGATIWTYDSSGELREKCAVIAGGTMAGVHMDEDGDLYFTVLRNKMVNGKPFLAGRGGNFGTDEPIDKHNRNPFVGALVKSRPENVKFLQPHAKVALDPAPTRPVDVTGGKGGSAWVEGAKWIYAGAGPQSAAGCTCPSMRPHLDWYKRTFLPESYRHSIGVVDTNGNLIMHIGSYGNFDSGDGPDSMIPVGGDNIGLTLPRFVSGTDNYLCFDDWAEKLVVLKLSYHEEESAGIQ